MVLSKQATFILNFLISSCNYMDAGKLFDIAVLDHLIIASGYYSFADNGML